MVETRSTRTPTKSMNTSVVKTKESTAKKLLHAAKSKKPKQKEVLKKSVEEAMEQDANELEKENVVLAKFSAREPGTVTLEGVAKVSESQPGNVVLEDVEEAMEEDPNELEQENVVLAKFSAQEPVTVTLEGVAKVSESQPGNVVLEDADATIEEFLQYIEDSDDEPEPEQESEPAPRFADSLPRDPVFLSSTALETDMLITKLGLTIPATIPFSRKRKDCEEVEDVFSTRNVEEAAECWIDNSNCEALVEECTAAIFDKQHSEPEFADSLAEGRTQEKSSKRKSGRPRKYGLNQDLRLGISTISSTPALLSLAPTQTPSASHGATRSQKQPSTSQNLADSSYEISDSEEFDSMHLVPTWQKKVVYFNDKGQPIGEGSAPFTSYIGAIMRKHLPISYEKWRDVSAEKRDFIWKKVTDEYIVPIAYKVAVLDRIHNYWRSYKSLLRVKFYDTRDTDEERKRNCPPGVKQEVWEKFVDMQSDPAAQARRKAGKLARQANKTPHTSGRTGAARLAETLKRGNPHATVTRTDIFLAMHSRKDGSCPTPELTRKVEQIKAIVEQNPESVNLDVDHDPVAQVCGKERGGRAVRAMGIGVSKQSLAHSAPAVEQLQEEKRMRVVDGNRIGELRAQVVKQREQIGELRCEDKFSVAAEKQISELREQINLQGLMIADMKELITRLCN